MPSVLEIQELNRQLAAQIKQEAQSNPGSRYAGKKVGLANGEVVVIADTWREVLARLQVVQPDRRKTMAVNPDADTTKVYHI